MMGASDLFNPKSMRLTKFRQPDFRASSEGFLAPAWKPIQVHPNTDTGTLQTRMKVQKTTSTPYFQDRMGKDL